MHGPEVAQESNCWHVSPYKGHLYYIPLSVIFPHILKCHTVTSPPLCSGSVCLVQCRCTTPYSATHKVHVPFATKLFAACKHPHQPALHMWVMSYVNNMASTPVNFCLCISSHFSFGLCLGEASPARK